MKLAQRGRWTPIRPPITGWPLSYPGARDALGHNTTQPRKINPCSTSHILPRPSRPIGPQWPAPCRRNSPSRSTSSTRPVTHRVPTSASTLRRSPRRNAEQIITDLAEALAAEDKFNEAKGRVRRVLEQKEPRPEWSYWDRPSSRTEDGREAAFQLYLETTAPYFAVVESNGGKPWFGSVEERRELGSAHTSDQTHPPASPVARWSRSEETIRMTNRHNSINQKPSAATMLSRQIAE